MPSLELRAKILMPTLPPPMFTIAKFEEVSTVSGTVGIIRMVPFWQAMITAMMLSCISSGTLVAGVSVSSIFK